MLERGVIMERQRIIEELQRVWDRLCILSLTLKYATLEDCSVKEVGEMISDIIVDDFDPAIEALKTI